MRTRTASPFAVLALGAVVLTGCSTPAAPAASPSVSASDVPSPSASALPDDTATELFTVAVKARAADGTTLDLELTGHTPVASTDSSASGLLDDFLNECQDAGGLSLSEAGTAVSADSLREFGSALMRIDYSVGPGEHTLVAPVDVFAGIDNFPSIATGDGVELLQSTDTCLNRYALTGSGDGFFVADFESGEVTPDLDRWKFGSYGFTVPSDSGATLEACDVTITDLGREDLAEVPGWPDGAVGTGISCGTGYVGE